MFNLLTDRTGMIDHLLEHEFNVVSKAQFKASKQRSIGDFSKTAEITEFSAKV